MNNYKQYIIMRKDLNMTKGKIAAQAGHACLGIFLQMAMEHKELVQKWETLYKRYIFDFEEDGSWEEWLRNSFVKICLAVGSLEELDRIAALCREEGIRIAYIEDNGTTMFDGVKTPTCFATEPVDADEKEIQAIFGGLKLL